MRKKVLFISITLLLISTVVFAIGGNDGGIGKKYGNFHWKAPVDAISDLPATASEADARLVKDVDGIYVYDGTSWVAATPAETDPLSLHTADTDNVKDTHIDWGAGTNQVNTSDMPEGTNLYYTNARVAAYGDLNYLKLTPQAPLTADLQINGGLWLDGTTGDTPTSGTGTRLMWIPSLAAFRAGAVGGTEWDNANIGSYSVAFGDGSEASGTRSFAAGWDVIASGDYSVALGRDNDATGDYSFAAGSRNSCASGDYSFASGNYAQAGGQGAISLGAYTQAWDASSMALGYKATASETGVVAIGQRLHVMDITSLDAEKITNGAFTGSASDWTLGAAWQYSSNSAEKYADGVTTLSQASGDMVTPLVVGEMYLLTYVAKFGMTGTVTPSIAGVTLPMLSAAQYDRTETFVALSTAALTFTPSNTARFRIDDVSLKKVTGGDLFVAGDVTVHGLHTLLGTVDWTGITGDIDIGSNAFTTTKITVDNDASYGGGYVIDVFTVQTIDATVTDITTVAVAEGDVFLVEVQVIGRKSDGAQRALYHRDGLFYRNAAGNVTQEGATISLAELESDADWDCTLNADTANQTIDVRVTGVADTTIDWKCTIKYMKVT